MNSADATTVSTIADFNVMRRRGGQEEPLSELLKHVSIKKSLLTLLWSPSKFFLFVVSALASAGAVACMRCVSARRHTTVPVLAGALPRPASLMLPRTQPRDGRQ